VTTLRNPRVRVIYAYFVTPALTGVASGSFRLGLPIFAVSSENSYCSSNGCAARSASVPVPSVVPKRLGPWNRLGCPGHPEHQGTAPGCKRARHEEEINSLQYLIGATSEGATRLRQDPDEPLLLRQLIFLNRDDDIRAWLLANSGHDPLDLLVLESRPEDGDDLYETPEPPNGRYAFFDGEVWDEWAGVEDAPQEMQEEEWIDEDEWLQADPGGTTRAPCGAGLIVADNSEVSI